jgi:hypothetical protein
VRLSLFVCSQGTQDPAKSAKSGSNIIMLDTLTSLRVADLKRRPDTSRVFKIWSDQRYKQYLISVMIIELPRYALYETQQPCRFGNNCLNMAQKGHPSVKNVLKVLNFLDLFKFMTPNVSPKSTCILQRSSPTFFQCTNPASGSDHSETCGNRQNFQLS